MLLDQLAERVVEPVGAALLEQADREEERERRHDDEPDRQRDAEQLRVVQAGEQVEDQRQRADRAAERDEREQREPQLLAPQPPQVDAAWAVASVRSRGREGGS